jgi:hypothetical protein
MPTPRKPRTPDDDQPSLLGGTQPAATAATTPPPAATAATDTPPPAAATAPDQLDRQIAAGKPAGNGTALAPVHSPALAVADEDNPWDLSADELADVLGADGLGEVDAGDFRIAYIVFNVLNKDGELADGTPAKTRRDQFWNTLTNRISDWIDVVLVAFHKTHDFSRWNNKINETERFCRSNDRVTGTALRDFKFDFVDTDGAAHSGTVAQGQRRPCRNCPQQKWRTFADPESGEKRQKVDCSLVRQFVGYETVDPAVIRFKRSSSRAIQDFLTRYHIGKLPRKVPVRDPKTGKATTVTRMFNYPLYSFRYRVTLVLDKSGNFAVPAFEKLEQFGGADVKYWKGQHDFIAGVRDRVIDAADKQESAAGPAATEDSAPAGDSPPPGASDEAFDRTRVPEGGGAAGNGPDEAF